VCVGDCRYSFKVCKGSRPLESVAFEIGGLDSIDLVIYVLGSGLCLVNKRSLRIEVGMVWTSAISWMLDCVGLVSGRGCGSLRNEVGLCLVKSSDGSWLEFLGVEARRFKCRKEAGS